jgi:3,4-dihydroxy 2-butanone 4-phosphate synthase/GTP cyclohydrolase II
VGADERLAQARLAHVERSDGYPSRGLENHVAIRHAQPGTRLPHHGTSFRKSVSGTFGPGKDSPAEEGCPMMNVRELRVAAEVPLSTDEGEFLVRAFPGVDGVGYLALSKGDLTGPEPVLARLHSECVTGEVFGSRHCDCGPQLRLALRTIEEAGRGVLVYALGHEGRGIGIVDKLRAYALQRQGVDTVDANLLLGLPVDARDHDEFAQVLRLLHIRSVQLMTNNPDKASAVERAGVAVSSTIPLHGAPNLRAMPYIRTKQHRLGHVGLASTGATIDARPPSTSALLGALPTHLDRPAVVLKFAQTLDGRIAATGGDARWISGVEERRLTHAIRSACDGVLVGVGTVLHDDPQLTVRMVEGSSPVRIVLDSTLRTPPTARLFDAEAPVVLVAAPDADAARAERLRAVGARIVPIPRAERGVDVRQMLEVLSALDLRSILVEGGARVITSFLQAGVVDRAIVSVAPIVLGRGIEAVEDLGNTQISEALRLQERVVRQVGEDIVIAGTPVLGKSNGGGSGQRVLRSAPFGAAAVSGVETDPS